MPEVGIGAVQYIKASEAEKLLGVERRTLKRLALAGQIRYLRPGGKGHWLFDITGLGKQVVQPALVLGPVNAIYARVSTRKQLPDLTNQISLLTSKYPDHVVFSDVASGLNFKRKGLLSLLQLAFERRLQVVRIAYRDRICRFAYDLIEGILEKHGAQIKVENNDQHAPEQELAEDVIAIITVFGARLYGSRSGKARKALAKGEGGAQGGDRGLGPNKTEDTIQTSGSLAWASADLQGADVPDAGTDQGAQTVFLSCSAKVQPNKRLDKRRRTTEQDQTSEPSSGATSA